MRILELFCGIGGVAAACGDGGRAEIAAAVDVDRVGLAVYAANFPAHRTVARTLDTIGAGELAAFGADAWTLSPPCQPYTRRGRGRDLDDPRSAGLRNLVARFAEVRPAGLLVENVPGFAASRAADLVRETLERRGYRWRETTLCPSELGWPNRRRRWYLVAGVIEGVLAERERPAGARPGAASARLSELVDRRYDDHPDLAVPAALAERYRRALDVVAAGDPAAVTACFTSAYGRSPVRSGSYLRLADGRLRRFHPREVLALLGFPTAYRLPPELPTANGWRLAGNSLSLPALRHLLAGDAPAAREPR